MRHATIHGPAVAESIRESEARLSQRADQIQRDMPGATVTRRRELINELASVREQQEIAGDAAQSHSNEQRRIWVPEKEGMPA